LGGQGEIDFGELLHLLRGYRVMPVAVRGGSEAQLQAAVLKGLAVANELRVISPKAETKAEAKPAPTPALPQRGREEDRQALIVDKPLRSGQQVYGRGRDLTVVKVDTAGADIIHDGQ